MTRTLEHCQWLSTKTSLISYEHMSHPFPVFPLPTQNRHVKIISKSQYDSFNRHLPALTRQWKHLSKVPNVLKVNCKITKITSIVGVLTLRQFLHCSVCTSGIYSGRLMYVQLGVDSTLFLLFSRKNARRFFKLYYNQIILHRN